MKAKCCICGKKMELEYTGHGMYQMSKAMKEHQKEHGEKVSWELTDVKPVDITTELHERLAEARSDTERVLIEQEIQRHEEGQRVKEQYDLGGGYINVWNCTASVIVDVNGMEIDDDMLRLLLSEPEQKKLDELIEEAVNEQGAISWSGQYYITERLARYIQRKLNLKRNKAALKVMMELHKKHEQEIEELNDKLKRVSDERTKARNIVYRICEKVLRQGVEFDLEKFKAEVLKVAQLLFDDEGFSASKYMQEKRVELGDIVEDKEGHRGRVIAAGIRTCSFENAVGTIYKEVPIADVKVLTQDYKLC